MNPALNPYESPAAVDELTPEQLLAMRRQQLQMWLAVPAMSFVVLGLAQGACVFAITAAILANLRWGSADLLVLVVSLADGLFMLAVAWAGYCMYQLRHLHFVRGIAFACCIPVLTPFCLFGIPFALWAIFFVYQRRAETFFLQNDLPGTSNQATPI
jgi:hypothetical protein